MRVPWLQFHNRENDAKKGEVSSHVWRFKIVILPGNVLGPFWTLFRWKAPPQSEYGKYWFLSVAFHILWPSAVVYGLKVKFLDREHLAFSVKYQ